MGKFRIDGIEYNIADETNLNQTISQIRSSDSHIKAQQGKDGAGNIATDTLKNAGGLAESLVRGLVNFPLSMGTQAGQVASDLSQGESLNTAGRVHPEQNKLELPTMQDSSKYYDEKIGKFFEWAKEQTGNQAQRIASNPLVAAGPAAMIVDRILRGDKDVPDNAAAQSAGEGMFDVGMGAAVLSPAAKLPANMRARHAAEIRAKAEAEIKARAAKAAEDAQAKAAEDLAMEQVLKEAGLTEGAPEVKGDLATNAIDRQRINPYTAPQFDARVYEKGGEHYGGRDLEALADRATPGELRTLNDEFQGTNPVENIAGMGPKETQAAIRQAGAEVGPRLAEDAPPTPKGDPAIIRRRAEIYYEQANRLLNEGKSFPEVEHLFKKADELSKQADSLESGKGIDYNTTDVRPNLVESIERASNKSTAIRNVLKEVRRLWDDVEANMQAASDYRMGKTNQGTVNRGPSGATQRVLEASLKQITETARELQERYGEYLDKYEQRKLQFYREKAEMYRRDTQSSAGEVSDYGVHKVYPDGIVKTERPNLGVPEGRPVPRGKPGGKQSGVIDPDILTFGVSALIRKLGNVGALDKFAGTFSPKWIETLKAATKQAQPDQWNSGDRVVWMSPKEFLELAGPRGSERMKLAPEKWESIRQGLATETGLMDGPQLTVDTHTNGRTFVTSHEGRHRMDEFARQGIEKVPVLITHDRFNGEAFDRNWPSRLVPEAQGRSSGSGSISTNPTYRPMPDAIREGMPMGQPGGKQAGVIDLFGGKPTLVEYAKRPEHRGIPEEVLKTMYEIEHGGKKAPPVETYQNQTAAEASKQITGISDYRMELKPVEEMVKDLQGHKDIDTGFKGKWGDSVQWTSLKTLIHDLQSSLSDTARTTNNPTLKAVYSVMEKAKGDISNHIENWVRHPISGIVASSAKLMRSKALKEEIGKFWTDVIWKEEGKRWVPAEELKAQGWSPEVIEWYGHLQKNMKDILATVNEVRVANGMKPVRERPGYFPGQFAGRWQVNAFVDNKIVGRFGTQELGSLKRVIAKLKAEHPDWNFGEIEARTRSTTRGRGAVDNAQLIFEDMMKHLDENADPRVTAAKELITEAIAKEVEKQSSGHQHFKEKKGIYGTLGFDPMRSGLDNFKDGIRAATYYAEQMAEWAEVNRHDKYVRAITDGNSIPGQANAQAYARQHWDVAMRRDLPTIGRVADAAVDAITGGLSQLTGIRADVFGTTATALKSAVMLNFFGGYNMRYVGTQLVQPLQSIMPAFAELGSKGVGGAGTVTPALFKGMVDFNRYFLGKAWDKAGPPKEIREAMKWAEQHDVIKPHFIEEMRAFHKDIINNRVMDWVTGAHLIRYSEQVARTQFYLSMFHYLKDSGLSGKQLLETAGNITNIKMVDYRPASKPLVFQKAGALGDLLSPLATFKMNYASQMSALFVEAARNGLKPQYLYPAGMMLAATYLTSGLIGMPLREDYDRVMGVLEKAGIIDPFSKWKIEDRVYSAKNNKGVWDRAMNFGAVSAVTGADVSLSFSAPSMTNPDNLFVIPGKIGETVMGGVQSIKERDVNPLLNQVLPQGGPYRWAFEQANTKKNGDVINVRDPQRGVRVHRTEGEQDMRALGVRSIRESVETHRKYLLQQHVEAQKQQMNSARDAAIRKIREGEKFPAKEIDKMLALGATNEQVRNLYTTAEKKNWTPTEQVLNRRSRSQRFVQQQKYLREE